MIPCKELEDILARMRRMQPGDLISYEGVEIRRTAILELWIVGLPHERPHSQHRKILTAAEKVRRLLKQQRKRRINLDSSR